MIEITPRSPVLTGAEVAVYLRMCSPDDDPDTVAKAVRCVHRLVRDGLLRPIKPGREYAFAQAEVERYVRDETEAFTTSKGRPSDQRTDDNAAS